jgi:hypothetical protein
MSDEKKTIPKFYMKDGVRHAIVPDGLKSLTDIDGFDFITESEYHDTEKAEAQEPSDAMRKINLRRADLAAQMEKHKDDVMNYNRLISIIGGSTLPTPWIKPPQRNDELDEDDSEDEDDYDEDNDFDEENYEDFD